MKLPSFTSVVFFAVILGLGVLSYKIYTRVAIEQKKVLKEATAHLDVYDSEREKTRQRYEPPSDRAKAAEKAKTEAEKARELLQKKMSETRKRKQDKK